MNIDGQADTKLIFQFASNELSNSNNFETFSELKVEKYAKFVSNTKVIKDNEIELLKFIWKIIIIFVELGFEHYQSQKTIKKSTYIPPENPKTSDDG